MLVEIQVNKTKKKVYALDENYHVMAEFPVGTSFVAGFNEYGQPYSNVEDGVYNDGWVWAEAYGSESQDEVYGWAFINIDSRCRAIHGGRNLEPYQDSLKSTYGCFRMYNADVLWLAYQFLEAEKTGYKPCIHVVS